MKKLGPVMIKDMQTPPPSFLRSGGNFLKDAEWA